MSGGLLVGNRTIAAVLVLALIGGCQPSGEDAKAPASSRQLADAELSLTPLELTAKAALEKLETERSAIAALEKRVKPSMDAYLLDPFSAQYRLLRSGRGGTVCGQVNAKNRMGAYVGFKDFVLARDGETLHVSKYSDGVKSEIYTAFADAYLEGCATKQEQARHAAVVKADDAYYYPSYSASAAATDAAAAADAESATLEDPFEDQ